MLSGVSPCGTCHMISPLSTFIAVSTPYGGFTIGSPCTLRPADGPPSAGTLAGGGGGVDCWGGRCGASAAQQSPGPITSRNSCRDARHVADIGELLRRRHQRARAHPHVAGLQVGDVRFWIGGGPWPVGCRRRDQRAVERTVDVAENRRRERRRLVAVALQPLERLRPQLRREVDEVVRHLDQVA